LPFLGTKAAVGRQSIYRIYCYIEYREAVVMILEVIFGALLFAGAALAISSEIYKDLRELVRS